MSLIRDTTNALLDWTTAIARLIFNALITWLPLLGHIFRQFEINRIYQDLENSSSYAMWCSYASTLDRLEERETWKSQDESPLYDYKLLRARLIQLSEAKRNNDLVSLMMLLRSGLLRNLGGLGNPKLFNQVHIGTKKLIEKYIDEVMEAIRQVAAGTEDDDLQHVTKLSFFAETQQSFGRTSLLLTGGSAFGLFHLGVVKALFDLDLLPQIICGSSTGALVAALVCVKTDEELQSEVFQTGGINFDAFRRTSSKGRFSRRLKRFFQHGVLMDVNVLVQSIKDNIGEMTFEEAYRRSGRILNIIVSSKGVLEVPRLLNYLTAPNVLIWSAAAASLSVAGLYDTTEILAKDAKGVILKWQPAGIKWTSVLQDTSQLPMTRLSELFNVNHVIASQVSPYLVPFYSATSKHHMGEDSFVSKIGVLLGQEFQHRLFQLAEVGLMPRFMDGLLNFVSQTHQGDINIAPNVTMGDYQHLLSMPTDEFVQKCIARGEQSTWPHISQIVNHVGIEYQLDRVLNKLRAARMDAPQKPASKIQRRRKSMFL